MTDKQTLAQSLRRYGSDFISHPVSRGIEDIEAAGEMMLEAARVLAEQPAEQELVKFLANGTRFKMSFFQNEDGEGNTVPGTHVTCFEAFEEELDGRWVALVPAEDDCHLKYTAPQPAKQPLTREEICDSWEFITGHQIQFGPSSEGRPMYLSTDEVIEFARAIERAHGIVGQV